MPPVPKPQSPTPLRKPSQARLNWSIQLIRHDLHRNDRPPRPSPRQMQRKLHSYSSGARPAPANEFTLLVGPSQRLSTLDRHPSIAAKAQNTRPCTTLSSTELFGNLESGTITKGITNNRATETIEVRTLRSTQAGREGRRTIQYTMPIESSRTRITPNISPPRSHA